MEGLGIAANVIAVVDISVKILQVCSQYAKEVKNAKADIEELQGEIETLRGTAKKIKTLIESPQGANLEASRDFAQKLSETIGVLSEVEMKLEPPTKSSFRQRLGFKSLKWPFQSGQVYRIVQRIHRCSDSLSLALQVDEVALMLGADVKLDQVECKLDATHSRLDRTHLQLDETQTKLNRTHSSLKYATTKIDEAENRLVLTGLPTAAGAAYNSYAEQDNSTCLKGTRSEVLKDIDDWLGDDNSQTIFWLQGMAGTGKSTIARTVATRWDNSSQLGASFFFKRGGGDRGNLSCFYTTIASQLAASVPSIASSIKAAIDQDPFITSKMAEEQFDKLISQPLSALRPTSSMVIAFVVDALDECDGDENIKRLINIFTQAKHVANIRVRVFITSRPELHIRLGFRAVVGSYQDFVLQEIPEDIIRRDIELFFKENLSRIREDYNLSVEDNRRLVDTWPGTESILALVEKAVPLFIFAATVCRFISQRRSANPNTQLQKVLAFETKSQASKMDATYLTPLEQQLEGLSLREQDEVIEEFHLVVGPIILLETPLTVPSLANLIDISEEVIYNRLDVLHSVLNYPKTHELPISLLHLSFRDFLLDPEKKTTNKFWVDEKQVHGQIAASCLRILASSLKEDICGMIGPGTYRLEVPPDIVDSRIPMELKYSCRYWVRHLGKSWRSSVSWEEILLFLENHLLHFLECMSLTGHLAEIYGMIAELQDIAKENKLTKLYKFLTDTQRFLRLSFSVVDQYPLQLYSSLRLCIPSTCLLHPLFIKDQPSWIFKLPNSPRDWDPHHQYLLEGHKATIYQMSFSLDNTHMVSFSTDGNLRIWRLDTGECIREIWVKKHEDRLPDLGLAISTNPMWVMFYWREQLYLFRGGMMKLLGKYELPDSAWQTPQLSPCARYCAFIDASYHLVLLHLDPVNHVSQVHVEDSTLLPNPSSYGLVSNRLFISFSEDSRRIAVCCVGGLDQSFIWAFESGAYIRKSSSKIESKAIDGDWFHPTTSVGLCIDRLMVAFCPTGLPNHIQIRWLDSGELIRTFESDGCVETTRFSKDCTILGSSCSEGEIRTWNIETGTCLTAFVVIAGQLDKRIFISADYQMAGHILGTQSLSVTSNTNRHVGDVTTWDNEKPLVKLVLSADATLAASILMSGVIQVWDFNTGNCITHLGSSSHAWHVGERYPWCTPNFKYMFIPAQDPSPAELTRTIEIWEIKTGQMLGRHTTIMASRDSGLGQDIAISPNDRYYAIVQYDILYIFRAAADIPHKVEVPGTICDITFSPDSSLLLIGSAESMSYDLDMLTDHTELISIYDIEKSEICDKIRTPRKLIRIVHVSMESGLLALHTRDTIHSEDRLEIISIRTEKIIRELKFENEVAEVVIDQDLKRCVMKQGEDWLHSWFIGDIQTGATAELDLYCCPGRVNFNTELGLVSTSFGDIRVDNLEESVRALDQCERIGLGLSDDATWILWNNTKIFWLPPAFRPARGSDGELFDICAEVSGSSVMIGTATGVSFFIFNIGDLPNCPPSFATSFRSTAFSQ